MAHEHPVNATDGINHVIVFAMRGLEDWRPDRKWVQVIEELKRESRL